MIIQHNIMALNSYNKLSNNNSMVQKNLEKLSSGYRINRAGDDAAGLAISEKMRAQITGLERAKMNAQDGISLVQTAEGALTEVHSMLNRLVELGTESANGIYQADDRQRIQDEVEQITEEIDRIADSTNFNGIKLLDGSLDKKLSDVVTENKGQQVVMPSGTLNSTGVTGQIGGSAGGAILETNATAKIAANTITDGSAAATKGSIEVNTAKMDTLTGTAANLFADGTVDALTFKFKGVDGQEKSFTLVETTAGGITTANAGKAVMDAINGGVNGTIGFKIDDADALKEFKELFSVTSSDNAKFKVEAKGAGVEGFRDLQISYGSHASGVDDAVKVAQGGTKAVIGVTTAAVDANGSKKIKISDMLADGGRLNIGGVTVNFDNTVGTDGDLNYDADAASTDALKEAQLYKLVSDLKEKGVDVTYETDGTVANSYLVVRSQPSTGTSAQTVVGAQTDATNEKNIYTITGDNTNADQFKITYSTQDGGTKEIVLYETAHGSVTNAAGSAANAIVNTLKGQSVAGMASVLTAANSESVQEFNRLFDVSVENDNLVITAKDPGTKAATIVSLEQSNTGGTAGTDVWNTANKASVALVNGSVKAQDAGVSLDLSTVAKGNTLTVGDKTYEFVAAAGDAVKKGNIAVTIGTDTKGTIDNLIKKLADDGVDAEAVDAGQGTDPTKILITTQVGSTQGTTGEWREATHQNALYNAKDFGFTTGNYDALKFKFNVDGTDYEFTLREGAKWTAADYVDIEGKDTTADIINKFFQGDTSAVAMQAKDSEQAALAKFKDNFDVSVNDSGQLVIATKSSDGSARLDKILHDSSATGEVGDIADSADKIVDWDASSNLTQKAGVALNMSGVTVGDKFAIGQKTYQFIDTVGDPVDKGAVAVTKGATDSESIKNLINALKKDGIDAEQVAGKDEILITSTDKLQVTQKGMDISGSSGNMRVEQQAATANSTKVTLGNSSKSGDHTLKINYFDGKENQQAEIKYHLDTSSTSPSKVAEAIEKAVKDSDLGDLFDVVSQNGDISFVAKAKGPDAAKVTGVSSSEAGIVKSVETNSGLADGKTISYADGTKPVKGDTVTIGGKTFEFVENGKEASNKDNIAVAVGTSDAEEALANLQKALKDQGINSTLDGASLTIADSERYATEEGKAAGGLTLQVGDTSDDFNKVTVHVQDMSSKGLGIEGLTVTDQGLASESIDKIKAAINKVSENRGRLGALQNRLEHTINNLATTAENMTAAESRIRDTDMAKEMMNFTKNNVLVQAAQAMLAQANQQPQQVLQLLR